MPDNFFPRRQLFLSAARSFVPNRRFNDKPLTKPQIALLPHLDQTGKTPTELFFRHQIKQVLEIDALFWSIRIDGLVQMPLGLTLDALQALPHVEISCTIACDANADRNTLIGHAVWRGVLVSSLFEQLGVLPSARFVIITAVDGYTTCLTVEALAKSVLAYQMNGDALPHEHGYPARLITPALYGYKMPKWIRHIEFVHSPMAGFWESRGAAMSGQVEPLAVIFSPRHREIVDRTVSIGGIAYGGNREIVAIQISIDDAPWTSVPFAPSHAYSWTPWHIDWTPASSGDYHIRVRASDHPIVPELATPHSVVVRVV